MVTCFVLGPRSGLFTKDQIVTQAPEPGRDPGVVRVRSSEGDRLSGAAGGEASGSSIRSLQGFRSAYASILDDLGGIEAKKATYKMLDEAQAVLELEDFQQLCSELKSMELWQYGMELVAERYAAENYAGGIQWLESLPDDMSSLPAFASFAKSAQASRHDAILDYSITCPDRSRSSALLAGLLSAGNEITSLKVIDVVNKTPDLMRGILYPLSCAVLPFAASGDYDSALRITEAIGRQGMRRDALRNLMISATQESPVNAANLIARVRSEEDRLVMVDPVVSSWILSDPEAASEWAISQQSQPIRDAAFSSMASNLLTVSHDEALTWAMAIAEPKLRESQIDKVFRFVQANGTESDLARLENQLRAN